MSNKYGAACHANATVRMAVAAVETLHEWPHTKDTLLCTLVREVRAHLKNEECLASIMLSTSPE